MKRLTKKIDNGRFVTIDAEARSYGETDPEDGFFYNYFTGEAVDKLAAYEDTGLEPADIEELLAAAPRWISVEERLPERANPLHARDTYLVRLESGCIKTLFYEYDNSDRCRPGMSPLFSEGWEKTAVPVTHWMPLPEPPKEDAE